MNGARSRGVTTYAASVALAALPGWALTFVALTACMTTDWKRRIVVERPTHERVERVQPGRCAVVEIAVGEQLVSCHDESETYISPVGLLVVLAVPASVILGGLALFASNRGS